MTEMPRRSIWRETILLYQLFQRALIPEQLNLRSLLQNWSNTVENYQNDLDDELCTLQNSKKYISQH